ncbi:hypothetical protein BDN72DRAFT_835671 [Pluteus cervinus]|uniref:Uncharacterized protein n=1 Tax=Pluteus cervinus TaxID=181527 RepID=A0ACD3B4R9_9AGAR|nr:hypothetical protein BDN72DRAFT_835671 [Pluteus cervinus]
MPATPLASSDMSSSVAYYLIGGLIAIAVGSMALSQGVAYLFRSSSETPHRLLVFIVVLLALCHVALNLSDLVVTSGRPISSTPYPDGRSPMFSAMFAFDGLIIGVVQGYYGWRCYMLLKRSIWIAISVAILILYTTSSWIYTAVLVQRETEPYHLPRIATTLSFLSPVVNDLMNTGLMITIIIRYRQTRHWPATSKLLKRILLLTIATNGFTITFATLLLASTLVQWQNRSPSYLAFVLLPILPFTYVITLLTWLFSRDPFLHDLGEGDPAALQYTSDRFSFVLAEHTRLEVPAPVIHVEKVTEVQHDRMYASYATSSPRLGYSYPHPVSGGDLYSYPHRGYEYGGRTRQGNYSSNSTSTYVNEKDKDTMTASTTTSESGPPKFAGLHVTFADEVE